MTEPRPPLGGRILVVDDSPSDLRLILDLLTGNGYVGYPASDGELGLRLVESTQPDLVLLDAHMPDPDGYEVCRRLKAVEATRHIPVMFISSTDHLADRLRAFSAGGVDYVLKPFQPDEILARIGTHLSLLGWQRALEERVRERTADLVEANVRLREEAAERRRTEATLRESEERYRALYEDTPSMYFTVDPAGTVLSVNSFGATQLGYTVDELVGGSVLRVFPEDQQAEAAAHVAECLANPGQVIGWRLRKVRKDGNGLHVRETARAVPGPSGEMVVLIVCEDITEQARVEARDRARDAVTRVLAASASLKEAAPGLLRVLCETLGWDLGQLWTLDTDASALRFEESWHGPAFDPAEFVAASRAGAFRSGPGLPGAVWRSRQPVWLPDVSAEPGFARRAVAAHVGLRGAVGFPILLGSHVQGVLELLSREVRPPDEELVAVLSAIGSQVGQFVERERAQEALRRSEAKYRAIVEDAIEGIFQTTPDGRFLTANPALARMLGYGSPEDLISEVTDIASQVYVDPAMRGEMERRLEAQGAVQDFVVENRRKDSGTIWVSLSARIVRDAAGEVLWYEGTSEDITDRKRAEQALRESQERYRMLTEMLPEAVVVHSEGKLVYVNPAGRKLFGAEDGTEWPALDVMERVHPAFRRLAAERIRMSYAERKSADRIEEVFLRLDGTPFDVETVTAPIMYMGKPATITVITDITERKRAEEALRESEERYRHITETVTDYLYHVGVERGRATGTVHSPGCVAVTGYTPEELASDPELWIAMVLLNDRAAVVEQAHVVLAGERFVPIEHRIQRKDGAVRWVRNTPVPQFGPDGSLVAYDGLVQDITERRILQEQLFQAQKMESIGRLAGGVAHDFNNLLTAVLGNLELANTDLPADLPVDHPLRADLEEILRAGEGAASLTRQLLSFASRQPIAPVRLNLSAVVADSLKMLGRLLGEDIMIATVLGPALGPVEADPGQIQQLLVNLAVNARDAMPEGGRLVIETANETVDEAYAATHPELSPWQYVRLSVTDTGVGMSEEVLAHLFEPFFTTKELGKGTGLGLATCHGIVRQIGGEISVDSKAGQGTTFRILLPQVEGIASEERAGEATSPTPTGTETVLVVEDEPAVRRLAVLGLRAQGYTVFEAADGDEALHIVARVVRRLDLLVSDVVMPGVSGPGLAERLLQLHPETKLLLMSGHAEATILPPALGMRGIPFLPKPFTPERLARKVREVLEAPREPSSATQSGRSRR